MSKYILWIIAVFCIGVTAWWFFRSEKSSERVDAPQQAQRWNNSYVLPHDRKVAVYDATISELIGYKMENRKPYRLIGTSIEGRELQTYRYGTGKHKILFVGSVHGGYDWNTALLAYQVIDYMIASPLDVPADVQVLVVPVVNPDGLFRVVGTSERFGLSDAPQFVRASDVLPTDLVVSGRFNARGVDLNRNFGCAWQPNAVWREYVVSAGDAPYSEPEAAAFRDFVLTEKPTAVIFFESASGGVYGSRCGHTQLPETRTLLTTYGDASGYPTHETYGHYSITGDAADWIASLSVPAITVELYTHNEIEWDRNKKGIQAVFSLYSDLQ